MGGIGTTLSIRRLRADADPAAFHRALWAKIDSTLRTAVSGEAGDQVLALYFSMAADDGFDDGSWSSSETRLDFRFSDASGLCSMSCEAALHWLEIVLWTDRFVHRVARDAGWEIVSVPRVPALLNVLTAATPTLVELRDNLYYVSRRPRGRFVDDDDFYSDDGIPRLTLAELNPGERLAVEAAAYSGECTCEYCRNVLPFVLLDPWQEGNTGDVTATWSALDEMPNEEAAASDAVSAFSEEEWTRSPLGPPALQALRDALATRDLDPPISRLVPMLLQRRPR